MHQWPETNEILIARVKDHSDAAAWSTFLNIYRPVVYRMAVGRGLQHADADDLAQKVFVSIARAIDRWVPGDDKPPFRVWLTRVARNEIINSLSRVKPDAATGADSVNQRLNSLSASDDASDELIRESRMQAMRWAAEQIRCEFSAATWFMFWETAILGRRSEEVAHDSERTVGAVYMARYRVTQRLKNKVFEASAIWSEV